MSARTVSALLEMPRVMPMNTPADHQAKDFDICLNQKAVSKQRAVHFGSETLS